MMDLGYRFPPGTAQQDADDLRKIIAGIDRMTNGDHQRAIRLLSMATGSLIADWGRVQGHARVHDSAKDASGWSERILDTWKAEMDAARLEADESRRQTLLFQIGIRHHQEKAA